MSGKFHLTPVGNAEPIKRKLDFSPERNKAAAPQGENARSDQNPYHQD